MPPEQNNEVNKDSCASPIREHGRLAYYCLGRRHYDVQLRLVVLKVIISKQIKMCLCSK